MTGSTFKNELKQGSIFCPGCCNSSSAGLLKTNLNWNLGMAECLKPSTTQQQNDKVKRA